MSPAFVPTPDCRDLGRAIMELVHYAESCTGCKVAGVRLALQPRPGAPALEVCARRVLKHAGRSLGLRCLSIGESAKPIPS